MSDEVTAACHPYDEKCGGPGGPCRNHGGVVSTPGGWSDEDRRLVEEALRAVDAGNAGHWPTVAGWLALEVRRLRATAVRGDA